MYADCGKTGNFRLHCTRHYQNVLLITKRGVPLAHPARAIISKHLRDSLGLVDRVFGLTTFFQVFIESAGWVFVNMEE